MVTKKMTREGMHGNFIWTMRLGVLDKREMMHLCENDWAFDGVERIIVCFHVYDWNRNSLNEIFLTPPQPRWPMLRTCCLILSYQVPHHISMDGSQFNYTSAKSAEQAEELFSHTLPRVALLHRLKHSLANRSGHT